MTNDKEMGKCFSASQLQMLCLCSAELQKCRMCRCRCRCRCTRFQVQVSDEAAEVERSEVMVQSRCRGDAAWCNDAEERGTEV